MFFGRSSIILCVLYAAESLKDWVVESRMEFTGFTSERHFPILGSDAGRHVARLSPSGLGKSASMEGRPRTFLKASVPSPAVLVSRDPVPLRNMGIFDASKSAVKIAPFIVIFSTLVHIPIANILASPGGPVTHILRLFLDAFTLNDYQRVVVITLLYYFMTYTGSAALSITGAVIGNPDGYQNNAPRVGRERITGVAHRMQSVHENLTETFPSFAICAAITLALPLYIADSTEPMNRCINFLLLAAFCKTVLYVPAYVFDYPTFRTFTHLMNNGALLGLLVSVIQAAHVIQDQDPLFDITME